MNNKLLIAKALFVHAIVVMVLAQMVNGSVEHLPANILNSEKLTLQSFSVACWNDPALKDASDAEKRACCENILDRKVRYWTQKGANRDIISVSEEGIKKLRKGDQMSFTDVDGKYVTAQLTSDPIIIWKNRRLERVYFKADNKLGRSRNSSLFELILKSGEIKRFVKSYNKRGLQFLR